MVIYEIFGCDIFDRKYFSEFSNIKQITVQNENLALTAVLTLKRITRECRFSLTRTGLSLELVVGMREALHKGHLKTRIFTIQISMIKNKTQIK